MPKTKSSSRTTVAFLELLEVFTFLEVNAEAGNMITPLETIKQAQKIANARAVLMKTIQSAMNTLSDGYQEPI